MLLALSAEASSLCGPFNIGLIKRLQFSASAQINLIIEVNSELMTGSQ